MYLGKKALHLFYWIDAISVVLLITFFVGPELMPESSAAEFMENYRGLLVYHCIIFAVLTAVFQKLHAEISMEFKSFQNRIMELEKKLDSINK